MSLTNKSEERTRSAKQTNPPPIATTVDVGICIPVSVGRGEADCVGVGLSDDVGEEETDDMMRLDGGSKWRWGMTPL